jgi:hypothetical protein
MAESSVWPAVSAVGAFAVATMALFGERLRSLMFRPKLKVSLADRVGIDRSIYDPSSAEGNPQKLLGARWYHVRVENESPGRWPVANDVRVYVTEVKLLRARFERIWAGQAPLSLQHEKDFNPQRIVGPPMTADLICVTAIEEEQRRIERPVLQLAVNPMPTGIPLRFTGGVTLKFKVVAISVEADSPPLFLQVQWDGQWAREDERMRQHFPIMELSAGEYASNDWHAPETIRPRVGQGSR